MAATTAAASRDEGYSIKEIARLLALPVPTVGTRLARGRERLREMLKEDDIPCHPQQHMAVGLHHPAKVLFLYGFHPWLISFHP